MVHEFEIDQPEGAAIDAAQDGTLADIQALEALGNQLYASGDHAGAEDVYRELIAKSRNVGWCYLQLGRIAARLEQWQAAADGFDAAVAHDEHLVPAYLERAIALRKLGANTKVLAGALVEVAGKAIDGLADEQYAELLLGANEAFDASLWEEAQILYEYLVAHGKGGYLCKLRCADALLYLGNPKEALRVINLIGSDPDYQIWTDFVRAKALLALGESAVALLERLVEKAPDNPHFVRLLFRALERDPNAATFRRHRKVLRQFGTEERLDFVLRSKLACKEFESAAKLYSRLPEALARRVEKLVSNAIDGLLAKREFQSLDRLAAGEGRTGSRRLIKAGLNFAHLGEALASAAAPARSGRAAVVGWDLSHNPAGRAYVLYRLLEQDWKPELIGPIWARFGQQLWAPLREAGLTVRSFRPTNLADLWCEAASIALIQPYDVVIICKPRLPALIVGLMIAEQSRCPIVIDIDENDLSFERQTSDHRTPEEDLFARPYGREGTRLALEQLGVADAITVSSPVLQRQFPGHLVRHARGDDLPEVDRAAARWRLGFEDQDFVLAFIGTERAHKGLLPVLAAMQDIGDPRLKLLLAGTVSRELDREIAERGLERQIVRHKEFPMAELPNYLAAADLVPLLQDPEDPISQTQMPAKLSDALKSGVRIAATDVPPLRELQGRGVIDLVSSGDFTPYLRRVKAEPQSALLRAHRRRVFADEFSFAANRPRLVAAIEEARAACAITGIRAGRVLQELLEKSRVARAAVQHPVKERRRPASGSSGERIDIAFFWKQNDSDLFGRRSDMVAKYLASAPRVAQVVHFDLPLSFQDLRHMIREKRDGRRNVTALQLDKSLLRALGLADDGRFKRRVMVHDRQADGRSFAGRPIGTADQVANFVAESLKAARLDPRRTVAWVCPYVQHFSKVAKALQFRKVVVDLIDDQRFWAPSEPELVVMQTEYAATLRLADLALTNSEGNRKRFAPLRSDIVVIPNGAEIDFVAGPDAASHVVPEALASLRRPIIGYLGNLRDRIDWPLVLGLAERRPDWSFVLAGPVEEDRVPAAVTRLENVIFPGPVPYDLSHAWMRSFDVSIMPHSLAGMTESMNPLKIYNYLAAGAPVVTTAVANIEDVADLVSVAEGVDDFIAAIEARLAAPRMGVPRTRLEGFSWEHRVSRMLDLLGGVL
jgi:glycosyltransferase involved in cell wall biosynthesis